MMPLDPALRHVRPSLWILPSGHEGFCRAGATWTWAGESDDRRAAARLLPDQRRLPLPRTGLRRLALRRGLGARGGLVADRGGGGGLRPLAATLAVVRAGGRPERLDRARGHARRDECHLLPGDR